MKYFIYCRKSTDTEDKQVLSLESQENEMLKVAEAHGLKVERVFQESQSAQSVGRPIFRKMIQAIHNGEADAILCWKLDRLARNMVEGGEIIDLLQRNVLKEIRTYEGVYLPSDNTLLLAVTFGMANQYSRDLSVNVKRGNRAKLERGEWPNHAPFGYKNDKAEKLLKIDKPRAKAVVRMFTLYGMGNHSMNDIVEMLYQEGYRSSTGKKLPKSLIERTLKNTFYFGLMERDGKYYQGKHKPIITKAQYEAVQFVFEESSRPRKKSLFFTYRGLLVCNSCTCAYTASKKKGHDYYYCTNGKGVCEAHKSYLRSEKVSELIAESLGAIQFDEELIEIMHEAAREKYLNGSEYQDEIRDRLEAQLQALDEQELNAFDAFSSKILRRELYEKKVADIEIERLSVKKELKQLPKRNPLTTLEPIKNLFLQANKAQKRFLEVGETEKRNIASDVLWNLSIENGNVAQIKYKEPFQLLANTSKNASISTLLASRVWNRKKLDPISVLWRY